MSINENNTNSNNNNNETELTTPTPTPTPTPTTNTNTNTNNIKTTSNTNVNNNVKKVPSTPSKSKIQQQQQTPILQSQSTTSTSTSQQQTVIIQPQNITNTLQQQQAKQQAQQKQKLLQQAHINSLIQSGPPQLSPPALFGTIEPLLYRTNSLYPANFPYIKLLGLKTVVQLSPEVPIKAVSSFFQENNINLIHLGLKSWKVDSSWKPLTDELIKECLEIVLNYDYYPLMITCTSGVHQTGVLVGCLRRLQNWNLTSILVEYKAFSGQSNTRYVNEQFIELFDVDLVTFPNRLPTWFIEQQKMLEEELEEFENSNNNNNNNNNNNKSLASSTNELSNIEDNNNNNNNNNTNGNNSINSSSNSISNK